MRLLITFMVLVFLTSSIAGLCGNAICEDYEDCEMDCDSGFYLPFNSYQSRMVVGEWVAMEIQVKNPNEHEIAVRVYPLQSVEFKAEESYIVPADSSEPINFSYNLNKEAEVIHVIVTSGTYEEQIQISSDGGGMDFAWLDKPIYESKLIGRVTWFQILAFAGIIAFIGLGFIIAGLRK